MLWVFHLARWSESFGRVLKSHLWPAAVPQRRTEASLQYVCIVFCVSSGSCSAISHLLHINIHMPHHLTSFLFFVLPWTQIRKLVCHLGTRLMKTLAVPNQLKEDGCHDHLWETRSFTVKRLKCISVVDIF